MTNIPANPPLPLGVAPGPWPGICANMAYIPRTRPNFPGDIQHDFRDFQAERRLETLAFWIGDASDDYLAAARLVGARDDPIADCFANDTVFDARTVWVAHDRLAAHWRASRMPALLIGAQHPPLPPHIFRAVYTYRDLLAQFRLWLGNETRRWMRHDIALFRLLCRTVVGEHLEQGRQDEALLYFQLRDRYPLPG